jgi:probable biosynthetic protein (TIGR04099 family)
MHVLAFPRPSVRAVSIRAAWRLGMAHLSPSGLSEQWLLRECGDRHWSLIAQASGQDRAVFRSGSGEPIYAAFCATALELHPLGMSLLGEDLVIASELFRVGAGRLGSVHEFLIDGRVIGGLRMISTFVSHDSTRSNRSIVRNHPMREAVVAEAPASLIELSAYAQALARQCRQRTERSEAIISETPCPELDFNAAGLLYFPTFTKLAEMAMWRLRQSHGSLASRTVAYLGNIDMEDSVTVHRADDGVDVVRSDGRIIAHIHTRRHLSAT